MSSAKLGTGGADGVTFKYKDYRIDGPKRYKTIALRVLRKISESRSAAVWLNLRG